MSLLLDALKKAEEAKRQAAAAAATPAPGTPPMPAASPLSLEPVAAPTAPQGLPDLADHLDTVDADLAAISTAPPPRKAPAGEAKRPPPQAQAASTPPPGRDAIRNAFAAKRPSPADRPLLWLLLAGAGLAAAGIGGWFWWQLQAIGSGSLAARPAATPAPAAAPPPLPLAPPAPLPVAAAPALLPPADDLAPPTAAGTAMAAPAPARPAPERTAAPPADNPVRITRGELRVAPALAKAYEQMQADDLAGAARSYEQVLRADPRSIDALVGMAVLSLRQGRADAAEGWYLKALEADPKDANAQAGLTNLRGQADPVGAESRLKGLLAAQPESAALNFALGNLYAGQHRWPEAQQAYFNAHATDPANPDYLFNLAASLDHLHLPKLALDYYQAALAASAGRRPGFDVAQVRARLLELQR